MLSSDCTNSVIGMASMFSRSKRGSVQKQSNRSSSLLTSPNVSVTTQHSERSTSRRLFNSTLNSSYEEYSKDESFDVLPKTDYTYAKSGSYSPRHLRKNWVNPNMSRHRLRGMVTPPVSMLDDSDSDSDMSLNEQVTYERSVDSGQRNEAVNSISHAQSNRSVSVENRASSFSLYEADQLDFDSDGANLDGGEPMSSEGARMSNKELAEEENLRIQQSGQGMDYRHYYEGMTLRSGSHLKGVKRFLDSKDPSRRKTTSVINHMSADSTSNALDILSADAVTGGYAQRRRSDNAGYGRGPGYGPEYTTTTTTTVTKTVMGIDEDELNTNNSARPRRTSRSPAKKKAARGRSYEYDDYDYKYDKEHKRRSDERQKEKHHRVNHMYGLDETDDFSDSDSYSYTTSRYASKPRHGTSDKYGSQSSFMTKAFMFVTTVVTTIVESISYLILPVGKPVWKGIVDPLLDYGSRVLEWLWEKSTTIAKLFILMDTWMLSRNTRRGCCLCLPLLMFFPLCFVYGHYVTEMLSMGTSSIFGFSPPFLSPKTVIRQGDTVTSINLQYEVKQILKQLQSEKRDWLSKMEIETLVQGMLKPELESLRVNLLSVAKDGNHEKASLKVDQNDAKHRLAQLEQQLAALQAKANLLEGDLTNTKSTFVGTLTGDRDTQVQNLVTMEKSLTDLQAQVDSLQASYMGIASHSKSCCPSDSALVTAIKNNVNLILAEMFGADGKAKNSGGSAFSGWLNQNYVDRGEFDRQIRTLTADISRRITSGIDAQRSGYASPITLPSGAGKLGEDAVKLIVEDALLKFSADRTGLPDYALESAGGSVISVRCSETYYRKTALISIFGIPLWYTSNSARTVIQPDVHPGQCWAFKGDKGFIVIQLAQPIRPTSFSLEHIPKSLSNDGKIDSAPKDFTVFGLTSERDTAGVNLGNYTYETVGKPIQHFDVQIANPGVFGYVELRVLSNHGSEDYTCIYRFRVHGVPSNTF
ncbi:SUN domain-containing protein 2-like isoform X2 [Littorina saxatilis]|uniref:SUN domain-containing protein 2-like isoform X2 n=1 Tax=Littorina saxatilis TaxID=31220 RepID=UPI0038B5919E